MTEPEIFKAEKQQETNRMFIKMTVGRCNETFAIEDGQGMMRLEPAERQNSLNRCMKKVSCNPKGSMKKNG